MIKNQVFFKIVFLGLVAGLTSFLFLGMLNYMVSMLISGQYKVVNRTYIVISILIILFSIWSKRALAVTTIRFSQKTFWEIRAEVLRAILNASDEQLRGKKEQIHSVLVNDVGVLTQGALNFVQFITSVIILFACLIYMAISSLTLFGAVLATTIAGGSIYLLRSRKNIRKFERVRDLENDFMKYFNSILAGFKEIHLDSKIGAEIYSRKITTIAKNAYRDNSEAYAGLLDNQLIGQSLFNVLVASILLYFSVYLGISAASIISFIFLLQYLLGATESIMVLLPSLLQARISENRIRELKKDLRFNMNLPGRNKEAGDLVSVFSELVITDLQFGYKKNGKGMAFEIGPLDMTIRSSEIIFIYGGNGSGKTTFMFSLLGLVNADGGAIYFDGCKLGNDNYEKYKSLFSVVFNDYYLFDEFYGIDDVDLVKADRYLRLFEIDQKVSISNKRFSTIDLSTGQRKRLAFIAALLRKRPILVIDEWASDQDPHFRRKFYTKILPLIKDEGITIVAITHDDSYYHLCDRLFKMEDGRMHAELIDAADGY